MVKAAVLADWVAGVGVADPAEGKAATLRAEADRLVALGTTEVRETLTDLDHFVVMHDPEDNEFCLT